MVIVIDSSVLPEGRSFTARVGIKFTVLPKAGVLLQHRNQGYSSAQRQVFQCKLRNQGCSSTEDRAYSPTFPSLQLRHNSSVALPTSLLILQPFHCLSYVTSSSLTSPGEPTMEKTYYFQMKNECSPVFINHIIVYRSVGAPLQLL